MGNFSTDCYQQTELWWILIAKLVQCILQYFTVTAPEKGHANQILIFFELSVPQFLVLKKPENFP